MKTELYTEDSAFSILKNHWGSLIDKSSSNEIFLTWQWQNTWWRHFGKDKALRIMAFRQEKGALIGLASFSVESFPGGKRVMRFLGGTDVTDYLDIIARAGYEEDVCKNTVDFWRYTEDEWDFIDLHCLKESSIALNVLKQFLEENKYYTEISVEDVCPRVSLPPSWGEYLESLDKKDRHELRRKVRRVERVSQSGNGYSIEDSNSVTDDIEQFLLLHRKSDVQKEGFMDKEMEVFFQDIANILFTENWLKLSFLQIDGTCMASSMCFDYQNKLYLYNSGYDPEYSYLSPGIVLMAHLIREAIESGRSEFDFLRGEEPYKYHLGAKDSSIYRMVISKESDKELTLEDETHMPQRDTKDKENVFARSSP
ncbi:MAG: GNAT family N-acetyltransferase [Thermodesulfobacteriota bacterium]